MFVGPVFSREATTAPRRIRFHALPAVGAAVLLCLLFIVWTILGSLPLESAEAAARFGSAAFELLAPLVMAVSTLFAALLTAAAVAQEKDRKTLVLLLLTRMNNSELVLGRLAASLLEIVLAVAATAPLFFLMTLFGGITTGQVLRVLAITLASAVVAGSIGSTLALWRETTFQALAATTLTLLTWLAIGEALYSNLVPEVLLGIPSAQLAAIVSPWRAVVDAARPQLPELTSDPTGTMFTLGQSVVGFFAFCLTMLVIINGVAIALVRYWNPSRAARDRGRHEDEEHSIFVAELDGDGKAATADRHRMHRAPGKLRKVWDNPVLWREMRTWAYGKKVFAIRLAYLGLAAFCGLAIYAAMDAQSTIAFSARVPSVTGPFVALVIVSLVLLNALAVTSITTERDGKSLDLLLATDLTPKEIVYGKLLGALYNAKEMLIAPLALAILLGIADYASVEDVVFMVLVLTTLFAFAVMVGVHSGMHYIKSRQAVATSIGTLLFLFIGIAVFMRMMLALGTFDTQFLVLVSFVIGGFALLYIGLGAKNPSDAIFWTAITVPFATFYVITSFLKGDYGPACLVTLLAYGFATAAMLVPAIAEFDVTTGRTGEHTE